MNAAYHARAKARLDLIGLSGAALRTQVTGGLP